MEASHYPRSLGSRAPDFALPGVDGRTWRLADFDAHPVLVVVWSCNHCPYVQAYEDRMIAFQKAWGPRGVQMVLVNANETVNYPEDDLPHMVERARSKGYAFPYLRDEDQRVADAYGAVCTPHFQVFDRERALRYQGRLDDNRDHPEQVKRTYLADACEDLLAGRPLRQPESFAIGCSIKWTK